MCRRLIIMSVWSLQHELVVVATAGSGVSEARVVVHVMDDNDHLPAFPRTTHETQITEEDDRHLPKTILTVSAQFDHFTVSGHKCMSENCCQVTERISFVCSQFAFLIVILVICI